MPIYVLQLCELKTPKRLGEDVCELSAGLDELEGNLSSFDNHEKVILDVDVIAPVVENGVLGKSDGRLIAHHQSRWASFFSDKLTQQPVQPNTLACHHGRYDVLCLACGRRHHLYFCDYHAIGDEPRKTSMPKVLFHLPMPPAMSVSLKPFNYGSASLVLGKTMP
jgi:hypothetical protein